MREIVHTYLTKMVGKPQNTLNSPLAQTTIDAKETQQDGLKSHIGTSQEQASHPAVHPLENKKKQRIPFVALALVFVVASLFIFSLLSLRPVALADHGIALDPTSTPAPGVPEAAPINQTTSTVLYAGTMQLGYGGSCNQFHSDVTVSDSTDPNYNKPDPFCWNDDDFLWGNRDTTCIYNDMHGAAQPYTLKFHDSQVSLPKVVLNQNTCTDNSTCVSDNGSNNDQPGQAIHDQVGGDNILCANNACTNVTTGVSTECGDPTGGQMAYDKFACHVIDESIVLADSDPKKNGGTPWQSTGVAINPTAYDPNGALYLPTYDLRALDIDPTSDSPACDGGGHWTCPAENSQSPNVVILRQQSNLTTKNGLREVTTSSGDPTKTNKVTGPHSSKTVGYSPGGQPVPIFWVACDEMSGGWAFPCSDLSAKSDQPYGGNMPFVTYNAPQSLDDGQVNEPVISKDWLSGNYDPKGDIKRSLSSLAAEPGHLVYTYLDDTLNQPSVQNTLFPIMMGVAYAFLVPVVVLIGYQFLWSSWTLVRANAMETFGRLLLSIIAISISYELAGTLIALTNALNIAIISFHAGVGAYQPIKLDNHTYLFSLASQGESDPTSFRGVVVPITRWGCIANDFVDILSTKFWGDVAGFIPILGGAIKFITSIFDVLDLAHHIGEFVVLILSINLCVQVFVRIVLLNYYILTGPIVFACWGLPGKTGQNVVGQWAKGFFSLLLVQTVQLFVLATLPLILPDFPVFPNDKFGLLTMFFAVLPRVLILAAVIKVPQVMGTGATKAMAQAGTVAGGAVAAAGAMAYSAV